MSFSFHLFIFSKSLAECPHVLHLLSAAPYSVLCCRSNPIGYTPLSHFPGAVLPGGPSHSLTSSRMAVGLSPLLEPCLLASLPPLYLTIKWGRTCHSSFQDLAHLKMSLLFPLFTQRLVGHINVDKNTWSQNFEGTASLFSTSLPEPLYMALFFFSLKAFRVSLSLMWKFIQPSLVEVIF